MTREDQIQDAYDAYYDETWDEHGGKARVVDYYHDVWFPSQATNDFFKAGAKWADEHPQNQWHDAESDDLPPYDKDVIVLCRRAEYFQEVCFAHRPDPKVDAQTYGEGGWNIEHVRWWLDVELPKVEEQ